MCVFRGLLLTSGLVCIIAFLQARLLQTIAQSKKGFVPHTTTYRTRTCQRRLCRLSQSRVFANVTSFPIRTGYLHITALNKFVHRAALTHEHSKCAIGTYVQAHDEPLKTNSNTARTIEAIYLRPKDHGHEVYDLHTERPITRRSVTPCLSPPS